MSINKRIRELRKELGYTIKEFSNITGIPVKTISNYERGERKVSINYLIILNEKFNASSDWIISGHGDMFLSGKPDILDTGSTEEKMSFINNRLRRSEPSMDFVVRFLKARKGDKRSYEEIRNIVENLKIMFE
ncbi:MAG: helix-turn-helix domain-containing protein [Candidatus Muiribacteriaceae bacterium]